MINWKSFHRFFKLKFGWEIFILNKSTNFYMRNSIICRHSHIFLIQEKLSQFQIKTYKKTDVLRVARRLWKSLIDSYDTFFLFHFILLPSHTKQKINVKNWLKVLYGFLCAWGIFFCLVKISPRKRSLWNINQHKIQSHRYSSMMKRLSQ